MSAPLANPFATPTQKAGGFRGPRKIRPVRSLRVGLPCRRCIFSRAQGARHLLGGCERRDRHSAKAGVRGRAVDSARRGWQRWFFLRGSMPSVKQRPARADISW